MKRQKRRSDPHVCFPPPPQSNSEFHENGPPPVVGGARRPPRLRLDGAGTGSQPVGRARRSGVACGSSEADPEASLRAGHEFLRCAPKTPVGARGRETRRDRPPTGVTPSPSPLRAPAALSCWGFWGLPEHAPLKVPTAREGGAYM